MSVIYGDRMQILLSKEEKYGIKPEGRGIILPIGFETEDEAKRFLGDLHHLKYNVSEGTDKIVIKGGIFRNRGSVIFCPREYRSFSKCIKLSEGSEFSWGDWKIADVLIRNTSLGKKLKEYWMKNEKGLTEEQTQKRLEEITPLANKK
jgi:hypothetical protein